MDDADETLMSRYRDGDVGAFEILYRRHRGGLYRYLLRQCGQAGLAEELFQDVWARLIGARQRYQVRARFTTFLYRMAHNRLVDHYRRQSRRPTLSLADPDCPGGPDPADTAQPGPERQTAIQQQHARLLRALEALPDEQREVFLLREESGLDLDTIAEITGASREAAKSRLRYAVAKLRRALGEPS